MCIVAAFDAPVDPLELDLQFGVEGSESLFDRRQQNRRANFAQYCVLVLPPLAADQVVLEAAKFVAVPDIDIACLKGFPQQAIDQELVPVDFEPSVFALLGIGVHIALDPFGKDACREVGRGGLPERLSLPEEFLEEGHRFQQRRILDQAGEVQVAKQMAQVELELGVKRAVVGPLERGPVLSEAFGIEQRKRLMLDFHKLEQIKSEIERFLQKPDYDLDSYFSESGLKQLNGLKGTGLTSP